MLFSRLFLIIYIQVTNYDQLMDPPVSNILRLTQLQYFSNHSIFFAYQAKVFLFILTFFATKPWGIHLFLPVVILSI